MLQCEGGNNETRYATNKLINFVSFLFLVSNNLQSTFCWVLVLIVVFQDVVFMLSWAIF